MKTEIVCILDRSGSMGSMKDEAIGGFNGFLDDQKAIPDPANLTLAIFDYEYKVLYDAKDIADIPPLTDLLYHPRGSTALLDAIGMGVSNTKERIAKYQQTIIDAGGTKPDAPKVVVMILTDGQENSSKEWDKGRVAKLIEECKKENWQFLFLSADMNGIADAQHYGLGANDIIGFKNSKLAASKAFSYGGMNVGKYRTSGSMASSNNKSFLGDTDAEDIDKTTP